MKKEQVFLYFSDWSPFLYRLDQKGIPHGDKIIKVYSSPNNPKTTFENELLAFVHGDGQPFWEDFEYPDRGGYTGFELESYLDKLFLNEIAKVNTRALFRFANLPETEFCQLAMSAKNPDGSWFIDHPLKDLDGLEVAAKNPTKGSAIHLDIFYPRSLERLKKIVNFDEEKTLVNLRKAGRS